MPDPIPSLNSALESLLENSSLTDELDDEAADVLLDWGLARVRQLFRQAADQTDPAGYLDAQLKANRKLLRTVNRWTAGRAALDPAAHAAALQQVLAYAGASAPPERQAEFLQNNLPLPSAEFIASLRMFCQN